MTPDDEIERRSPELSRADFFRLSGLAAAGLALGGAAACGGSPQASPPSAAPETSSAAATAPVTASPSPSPSPKAAYLAVAKGRDAREITRAAIAAVGGMPRFVHTGDDVIVKPNICVGYHPPEYAATTNPDVVAAIVELCMEAGAARVRVMDNPFGSPAPVAYRVSRIEAAVKKAGGTMEVMSPVKFVRTSIPRGRAIHSYPVYRDILKADAVINVPIAKSHDLSRVTLGGKNLLGCVGDRQNLHFDIGQTVADLASVIRPQLTVVDAVRVLMQGGPTGGSLSYVKRKDTVIASHDWVAADTYAARFWHLRGGEVPYVRAAAKMGLGTDDLDAVVVRHVRV